jgi:hypothetical protein
MSVLTKRRHTEAVAGRRWGCPSIPPALRSFLSLLTPTLFWIFIPVSLYFFYRFVACTGANKWECRVKTPRQHFEDVWSLIVLSSIVYYLCNVYPHFSPARVVEWAAKSSGETDLSPRPIPPASRWQHTLATRNNLISAGLALLGLISAVAAMFVLGFLGEISLYSYSLTQGSKLFLPPVVWVVGPCLALCALAILLSLYFSFSVGRMKDVTIFFSIAAAASTYFLVSYRISLSGPGPGIGCSKLLFHPHHFALAFMATLLCRSNGFKVPSSPSFFIFACFAYLVKCALCGLMVQGIASYGVDSILRSTSCATT